MALAPVTVIARGRAVVIPAAEVEAELAGSGPFRSLQHLDAVVRSPEHGGDRTRAIARLRGAIATGDVGVATMQAVLGLVRLSAGEAAAELRALSERIPGSPGAIVRAAAFLVEDRAGDMARAAVADPLLARHSPQAYLHLSRVPDGAALLFSTWVAELSRSASTLGSTAFRAFLGDVAEAGFRSLQNGSSVPALLGENGSAFLVDAICAELGGTTDFLSARGMAWLLGALARDDDTAHAAIERAQSRFRDAEFQSDCAAILAGEPWPPHR